MDFINQNIWPIATAVIAVMALLIGMMVWRSISPRVRGRRGQRLGISEYHELDKMRRLVLVRRDNVEHLVLIGGPQDVVIETGISSSAESAHDGAARRAQACRLRRPAAAGPAAGRPAADGATAARHGALKQESPAEAGLFSFRRLLQITAGGSVGRRSDMKRSNSS